jgi:hypothetical protein
MATTEAAENTTQARYLCHRVIVVGLLTTRAVHTQIDIAITGHTKGIQVPPSPPQGGPKECKQPHTSYSSQLSQLQQLLAEYLAEDDAYVGHKHQITCHSGDLCCLSIKLTWQLA